MAERSSGEPAPKRKRRTKKEVLTEKAEKARDGVGKAQERLCTTEAALARARALGWKRGRSVRRSSRRHSKQQIPP